MAQCAEINSACLLPMGTIYSPFCHCPHHSWLLHLCSSLLASVTYRVPEFVTSEKFLAWFFKLTNLWGFTAWPIFCSGFWPRCLITGAIPYRKAAWKCCILREALSGFLLPDVLFEPFLHIAFRFVNRLSTCHRVLYMVSTQNTFTLLLHLFMFPFFLPDCKLIASMKDDAHL